MLQNRKGSNCRPTFKPMHRLSIKSPRMTSRRTTPTAQATSTILFNKLSLTKFNGKVRSPRPAQLSVTSTGRRRSACAFISPALQFHEHTRIRDRSAFRYSADKENTDEVFSDKSRQNLVETPSTIQQSNKQLEEIDLDLLKYYAQELKLPVPCPQLKATACEPRRLHYFVRRLSGGKNELPSI